jgi:hypothetical protein
MCPVSAVHVAAVAKDFDLGSAESNMSPSSCEHQKNPGDWDASRGMLGDTGLSSSPTSAERAGESEQ